MTLSRPVVLAGGLSLKNVGEAICLARPFVVDLNSGVESALGRNNLDKVLSAIAQVADAAVSCLSADS